MCSFYCCQLQTEYRILQKESTMADDRLREINKVLDELRSSINTVFHQIGCDAKPIRDMLGGDAGLNNKNVMIYLGLVEHRTMNLLYLRNYLKMKVSTNTRFSYQTKLTFEIN